ncbi:MAG: NAD(P)/FAD-dependent oxidoreductase, partial [Acidimicrobiia bacterium]|nr:NAD(P)/FAD-dependent oxidoreductase [Acidimicrobiia bacterium]
METSRTGPDDAFRARVAEAVEIANLPTLLMVLVQLTGDTGWLGPRYRLRRPVGMDDNDDGGLTPDLQDEIRRAARDAIVAWRHGREPEIRQPDGALLRRMLSVAMAEEIPDEYSPLLEDQFNPSADRVRIEVPDDFGVVVVGAGFSGLCAGYFLKQAGIDFAIVERHASIGGTWLENTYPGAGVDTPSHLYSFTFAPHDWSHWFSLQPEVKGYMEDVAERFGLVDHIRFETEVTAASYDDVAQRWVVETRTADGLERIECAAVISAVGIFNPPVMPNIDGLDGFDGICVHTARWPADLDVRDKRVAVVGTGASSMQVVPAIADHARSVTVYQRSNQWVLPFEKFHQPVPEPLRWLLAEVPLYAQWYRARLGWTFNDKLHPVLQIDPDWEHPDRSINAANDRHRAFMTRYIESELGDHAGELLDSVLPDYPPYGKRILLDNGWFRTLTRDDVELVTDPIEGIDGTCVVTTAGERRETDVLIMATGFDVVRFLTSFPVRGRGGV